MKRNTKNSGFALSTAIMIIFGLLVVGGGVYYATQSSNESNDLDFGMESTMDGESMNEGESGQESAVMATNTSQDISSNSPADIQLSGEWGDDVNGRHIGYIKSISESASNTSSYSLQIDYIQWILCDAHELGEGTCMNGFQIVNDNPQLRNLQISNDVVITTANQDSDGNSIHPTAAQFQEFISQSEAAGANYVPYWITLSNAKITEIKFQYVP